MKKVFSVIGNVSFLGAVAVGVYALIRSYLLRKGLPEGTCPVEQHRPLYFIAIGLSILAFLLSVVTDAGKKKNMKNNPQ